MTDRTRLPALADAVAVLAFAAIGRRSHAEESAVVGILGTAAPFLAGALVGALVARSWRDPLSWRTGLVVWAGAVVVGLALRAGVTGRLPVSFAVVATLALGVLILSWRGVVAVIRAVRGRRERQAADRPA